MKNENGPRRRSIKETVKKKKSAKESVGAETDKSSIVNFYMDLCHREEDLLEMMDQNDSSKKELDINSFGKQGENYRLLRELPLHSTHEMDNPYDYSKITDVKELKERMEAAVPKIVVEISKRLSKLKWMPQEEECYTEFGPWKRPSNFDPPVVLIPKKRRPKPNPTNAGSANRTRNYSESKPKNRTASAKIPHSNEKQKVIPDITQHKQFSAPVDPIELKKRLADLLMQRSSKGEQHTMPLNRIIMKPLNMKKLICNNERLQLTPGRINSPRIQVSKQSPRQSQASKEIHSKYSMREDSNVSLPPKTKMAGDANGNLNIVHQWPAATVCHRLRKLHPIKEQEAKAGSSSKSAKPHPPQRSKSHEISRPRQSERKIPASTLESIVFNIQEARSFTMDKKGLLSRRLGDVSRNTKLELSKQSSRFDIRR